MKDLRTLLPSAAKAELYREIRKRLSKKYQKERDNGFSVRGELLAMLQIEVKRELEIDYPYLKDMNSFEAMFWEDCLEVHKWL